MNEQFHHTIFFKSILQTFQYLFVGAEVTALVRTLSNLPEELSKKITVVHGDSTKKEDVVKVVRGQDAVIVALGTRHDLSMLFILQHKIGTLINTLHLTILLQVIRL